MGHGSYPLPCDDGRPDHQFVTLSDVIVHVHTLSLALLATCAHAAPGAPRDRVINMYIQLANALNTGCARSLKAVLDADASGCISNALVALRELKRGERGCQARHAITALLDAYSPAGSAGWSLVPPPPLVVADGLRIRSGGDAATSATVTLTVDPLHVSAVMAGVVTHERGIEWECWKRAIDTIVPRAILYANGCHGACVWYAASYAMSSADGQGEGEGADTAAVGWARVIAAMLEAWSPSTEEALEDSADARDYVTGTVCTILCAYGSVVDTMRRSALVALFHPKRTAWHLSDVAALCASSLGIPTHPGPLAELMRALVHARASDIVEVLHGIIMLPPPPPPPPPSPDPHAWLQRRVDTHRYTTAPSPMLFSVLYAIERAWRTGDALLTLAHTKHVPHDTVSLATTVVVDNFGVSDWAPALLRPVHTLAHV